MQFSNDTFNFDIKLSDSGFDTLINRYLTGQPILERFTVYPVVPIKQHEQQPYGHVDTYRDTINGKMFETTVTYLNKKYLMKMFDISGTYASLFDILTKMEDQYVATFKFFDEHNRIEITGSMPHQTKNVMDFVISGVKDSLSRNRNNTIGFYYSILNSELKRLSFYDKIINIFETYNKN